MVNEEPQTFNVGSIPPMLPPSDHMHLEWLRRTAQDMGEDYARIFKKLSESEGRVQESGHEIEEAWATFLSNWLPPTYEVGIRKYIVGEVDTGYPFETDVVVFRPSYPKSLRKKTHVLVSGVAAAFSVKSTIRAQWIEEVTQESAALQRMLAPREGTLRKELVRPFPYGLLTLSHDWKKPGSTPALNVSRELYRRDLEKSCHPRESVDLICVPDLGVWNKATIFNAPLHVQLSNFSDLPDEDAVALVEQLNRPQLKTVHVHTPSDDGGQAIAVFLTALYSLLAIGDPTIAELARSFSHMGGGTEGSGTQRDWDPSLVLSAGTLEYASSGRIDGIPNNEHSGHFGIAMSW